MPGAKIQNGASMRGARAVPLRYIGRSTPIEPASSVTAMASLTARAKKSSRDRAAYEKSAGFRSR
jgi:hypothetical protein